MKLKNSYILLIVMSIFLLISIGSVCANDVSDAQLADDGSDVIAVDNGDSIVSDDDGNETSEKIDTSVVSEDVRINEGETANINVAVNDNESNPIAIEKANLTVTESNNNINFDYNNSVITILDNLAAGNHSLVISYLGNDNYTNSSTSIVLSVVGNYTMNVPDSVTVNGTKMVVVPIEITNGVDIYEINKNDLTLVLTYTENNETITKPINEFELENGEIKFDYTVNVITSTLAIDYTDDTLSFTQNTTVNRKFDTVVISEDVRVNEGESANITITVIDDEFNIVAIEKANITVFEADKSVEFEYNNSVITILNLPAGNHSLVITYLGNDLYTNSSTNVTASVVGNYTMNVPASVNVNSTNITVIPIEITNSVDVYEINKDNLTLTLSYTQDNETITIPINEIELVNGTIKFNYDGNITPITLTIDYTDDTLSLTQNTTLNRIVNAEIRILNIETEYRSGNFTFLLVDIDNNYTPVANKKLKYTIITGSINTAGTITTDENGIALMDNRYLTIYVMNGTSIEGMAIPVGQQLFSLESDDASVICQKIENNFTITKATIKIVIEPYKEYYGSEKQVVINVTNAKTGEAMYGIVLHLYMENTTVKDFYLMTGVNGTCEISVYNATTQTGLVGGTYSMIVSNNDTVNMENTTYKGSITIVPVPVKYTITGTTGYYNTGNSATIKVTSKLTGKAVPYAYVLVQLDGNSKKTYLMQANEKGIVQVAASLSVGKHKIKVSSADTRYSGSAVTKTITVKKATAKITAPKVTAYYKQGKYFTVKVTNTKNKKPIYDAKINIKIYVTSTSYYNYNGNTGLNGQLKLLIDLKPGTYKVVVKGNDNKDFTAKQVTSKIVVKKAPTKLYPKKLTAKKGANKYFKVTVKNTKTKKIIKGVKLNIKVYTGKKYKTYTVKTNSKGIANLNVKSLKVGTHKVVVNSANKYCTAKTAKSSIKIIK